MPQVEQVWVAQPAHGVPPPMVFVAPPLPTLSAKNVDSSLLTALL